MRAANDNFQPDDPVRLAQILLLAFPHGGMTVSGLRKEATRGRLLVMRIAGKDFTTMRSIEEMKEKCRVPANLPASGSGQQARIGPQHGSSSTAESSSALLAAQMIVAELKRPSPSTSHGSSLQRRQRKTGQPAT